LEKKPQRLEDIRNHNYGVVLGLIRDEEGISRQELSVKSGLTKTTVSDLVKVFLSKGIIVSLGEGNASSRGGRKPIHLRLNYNSAVAIGINIRREYINTIIANLKGDIVFEKNLFIDNTINNESLIAILKKSIDAVIERKPIQAKILGIGIGAPGPLNIEDGEILNPPDFGKVRNLKICQILNEYYELPVYLSLGAAAGAYGEFCYKKRQGFFFNNIVFIEIDWGIGFGYVIDGRTIQGDKKHVAGEIGHTIVVPHGKQCVCGQRGCLYQYASGHSIIQNIKNSGKKGTELLKNEDDTDIISQLELFTKYVNEGNRTVLDELHTATEYMSIAFTNIVNLLSPSLIVLGSSIPDFAKLFLDSLRTQMPKVSPLYEELTERIELTKYGIHAIAGGAANIVIEEFIKKPNQFIKLNDDAV
jgi:predicted NBD/HSP70 family sugar kinase